MGDLEGDRYLVTGANTGIGRATAEALGARGAHVILACRSEERTRPVLDAIAAGPGSASFLPLDLADLDSVRRAADTLLDAGTPIDVLVANAGLAGQRGRTAQGFELAFGTNHLGHFLLVTSVLDLLRRSAPARVVVVASDSHLQARGIDWDAVRRPTRTITGMREYEVSKLANVLFAQELARRQDPDVVSTYALHPGVIASDVWRRVPWPVRPLLTWRMRSPEEGAATSLRCATDPGLGGRTGRYWADEVEKAPNPVATPALAAELWERSEAWTAA